MQDEFDDEAMATREWTDAITSVIAFEGTERADHVLGKVVETARRAGARVPFAANTAYMNSISVAEEPKHPGNREIEHRIGPHPLERGRHRPARQQALLRARRPHRLVPVGGDALRHRLHALLARAH